MLAAAPCLLASAAASVGGRACMLAGACVLLKQSAERQLMGQAGSQPLCILPPHPPALAEPKLCSVELSSAPAAVWQLLASYFPGRAARPPSCLSISARLEGCEACTRGLQAAGFGAVTPLGLRRQGAGGPVEGRSDRCCLALPSSGTAEPATAAAVAAASTQQQPELPQRRLFDAVSFYGCFDVLDTRRALQAAHRHLHPLGLLAVSWTDRSLASALCLGLEELLEVLLPGYCRYADQHDPQEWVTRLQAGGLFSMVDYVAAPSSLHLPGLHALTDLLDGRGALRAALGSSRRRAFHSQLRRLVERHCGSASAPLELPLVTKAYLLAARQDAAPAQGAGRWASGSGSALGPERVCLFCGREVADG